MDRKIICICGPSGSGKSTLIDFFLTKYPDQFSKWISVTNRPMRKNESQGNPYYFVSTDDLSTQIQQGDFLEYEKKEFNGFTYGKRKSDIEQLDDNNKTILTEENIIRVTKLKKQLPNFKIIAIFLVPENMDKLLTRLVKRGDGELRVQARLAFDEAQDNFIHTADKVQTSYENDIPKIAVEIIEFIKDHS